MTIVEMAEKEFPINCWEETWAANQCRCIYAIGANAALHEIENIIKVGCDDIAFLNLLEDKIKELKGE